MPEKSNSLLEEAFDNHAPNGFSLIELIIAMFIFLIVTGSIYGVMVAAQRSRAVVSQQSQLNKSIRLSLNLVGRDTYNAGYGYPLRVTVILPNNTISNLLAIPNDADATRDTVPPIIVGNDITLNTLNTAANVKTDQITLLYKDSKFNLVGSVGATEQQKVSRPLDILPPSPNGDQVEIKPGSGNNSVCRINDIYLITGKTGLTLGVSTSLPSNDKVKFSQGDALGFNKPNANNISLINPTSIHRVNMVTYFVTAAGTLTRREYANSPPTGGNEPQNWVDEPLVYDVENFQIQYVMDNGSLLDNPSAGANGIPGDADDDQTQLAAIRQVRFTISVRSMELNLDGQPQRVTMSSTFSTRNLGYDAN